MAHHKKGFFPSPRRAELANRISQLKNNAGFGKNHMAADFSPPPHILSDVRWTASASTAHPSPVTIRSRYPTIIRPRRPLIMTDPTVIANRGRWTSKGPGGTTMHGTTIPHRQMSIQMRPMPHLPNRRSTAPISRDPTLGINWQAASSVGLHNHNRTKSTRLHLRHPETNQRNHSSPQRF